jgi:hypothetical protein
MIAVIFEVEPAEGRKDDYLDIAVEMRPMLDDIAGFISVERFQSLTDPRKRMPTEGAMMLGCRETILSRQFLSALQEAMRGCSRRCPPPPCAARCCPSACRPMAC